MALQRGSGLNTSMPDYQVGITLKSDGSGAVVSDFKKVGDAGKKAGGGLDEADKAATKSESSFKKLVPSVAAVAKGILAIGAVAVGAVAHYAKFGTAIAEVNTLLDNSFAAGSIEEISDSARDLAKTFGGSATEQAKAFYGVISAGAESAAEATEIMTAANKLAIGGVTDIETAAGGLSSVLNSYAASGLTAAEASDSLFAAVKEGVTTIPELSASLGNVAAIAESSGLKFDELTGSIATITSGGIKTAEAVTGLKAALSGMVGPGAEAAKIAKELGIKMSQSDIKSRGFATVLQEIRDKTGGNVGTMKKLLGSMEAVNSVLILTNEGGKKLADVMGTMAAKTGLTDAAFDKMTTGTAKVGFEWERTKSKISDAFLSIGEKAAPSIGKLLEMINKIDFTTIGERIGTAVSAVIQGAKAIYDGAMVWFDKFRTDPSSAAEEASVSLAQTFGKIAGNAFNQWGKIFSNIGGWLEKIKNAPEGSLKAMVESIKTWMGNMLSAFLDGFKEVAPEAAKALANLPETMKQLGIDAIKGLVAGLKAVPKLLVDAAKAVGGSVMDAFKSFFKSSSPSKLMEAFGKDVTKGLEIGILLGKDGAAQAAEEVATEISASFGVLQSDMNGYTQKIADSMVVVEDALENGATSATSYADTFSTDIGDAMADVILESDSFADSMEATWKRMVSDWARSGISKLFASLVSGGGLDFSGFSLGGGGKKQSAGQQGVNTVANAGVSAAASKGVSAIGAKYFAAESSTGAVTEYTGAALKAKQAAEGLGAAQSIQGAQAAEAALHIKTGGVAVKSASGATSGLGAAMGVATFAAVVYVGAQIQAARHQKRLAATTEEVRSKFAHATDIINTASLTWGKFGSEGLLAVNSVNGSTNTLVSALDSLDIGVRRGAEGMILLAEGTEHAKQVSLAYSDEVEVALTEQGRAIAALTEFGKEGLTLQEFGLKVQQDVTGEWAKSIKLINSANFDKVASEYAKLEGVSKSAFKAIADDGVITANELATQFGWSADRISEALGGASSTTVTSFLRIGSAAIKVTNSVSEAFGDTGKDIGQTIGDGVNEAQSAIDSLHGTVITNTVVTRSAGGGEGGRALGTGGKFEKVPDGYPNDSYPIFLQSGEDFMVRTPADRAAGLSGSEVSGGGGNPKKMEALIEKLIDAVSRTGGEQTSAINANTIDRQSLARELEALSAMDEMSHAA